MLDVEQVLGGLKDIAVDEKNIGLTGSPTRVGEVYEQKIERQHLILEGTPEEMVNTTIEKLRQEELV